MSPMQMLAELAQSWDVEIWHEPSDDNYPNAYRVELWPKRGVLAAKGEERDHTCEMRYCDDNLEVAIRRAWSGETPDGP